MKSAAARKRFAVPLRLELSGSPAARRGAPAMRLLRQWATAALGRTAAGAEIALRVVGAAESRRLNHRYRDQDKPTNVLSFPVPALPSAGPAAGRTQPEARPLGDLVICAAVLAREAREQAKPLRAHWAHLVVHGTLHLAGYDHVRDADAQRMERREVQVLRRLGFPNPYRQRVQP